MDTCRNGHAMTPENTRVLCNGRTRCRQCQRDQANRHYAEFYKTQHTHRVIPDAPRPSEVKPR